MTETEILRGALEFIASKSYCECWEAPGMGSHQPYSWRGCEIYHSDDPEEYCLCCMARAALENTKPNQEVT